MNVAFVLPYTLTSFSVITSCPEMKPIGSSTHACIIFHYSKSMRILSSQSDLHTPPVGKLGWANGLNRASRHTIRQYTEPPMQCCNAPYFLPAMFMSGWVKSYHLTLQRTSFPLYFDVLMFCHSSDS